MFGNIKKKLNNALQEGLIISESLQQQYLQRVASNGSAPNSPTTDAGGANSSVTGSNSTLSLASRELSGLPNELNMAAGCNMLAKYEDDWKTIHDANEVNAQAADGIAQQIGQLHQRTTSQRLVMTDLISCLSTIPTLVQKLEASMEALQELSALSESAEQKLEQLQDTCEQCELQEFMLQKNYELSQYKQHKMSELELYRQKLAAEHQEKVRVHDERWRQMQRERQAVFEDAFRGDLAEFKAKGSITKLTPKVNANELALEEVVLDDNETKDALEEFLNA